MNIANNLEEAARYFPDNPAIIENDRIITYKEFNRDISLIASAMVDFGIKPGNYVGLCAPNSYSWLVFYFGTLKAGAVAVTFSYLLKGDEFSTILSDCRPRILFTDDTRLKDLEAFRDSTFPQLVVSENGDISYHQLAEKGIPEFKTIDRDRHDIAAILYTGGTTGVPKGAMLSHQNIQVCMFNVARYERSREKDIVLCFLPLNHVFGQIHVMDSTICTAGGIVIQPSFDMVKALEAIKRYKVTKFFAVPTIYIRMLELPNLADSIKSVTYCMSAAASMAAEVVREWKERTGLKIYESYGMTESASLVAYNHYYKHVIGSVGTPANLVEVQIRDLDGKVLDQGKEGEICISGPNIFKGYLNNPEETEKAFWGEWFRSGDIGVIDKDGYLYVVDRLKDMVITGGENVYPREVEEVLYTYHDVLECAVIGLPDREYGEKVTAFIVPQKGCELDAVALKAFLKERLTGFKVPKDYITLDELPKSSAGKLLKRELRKMYS